MYNCICSGGEPGLYWTKIEPRIERNYQKAHYEEFTVQLYCALLIVKSVKTRYFSKFWLLLSVCATPATDTARCTLYYSGENSFGVSFCKVGNYLYCTQLASKYFTHQSQFLVSRPHRWRVPLSTAWSKNTTWAASSSSTLIMLSTVVLQAQNKNLNCFFTFCSSSLKSFFHIFNVADGSFDWPIHLNLQQYRKVI